MNSFQFFRTAYLITWQLSCVCFVSLGLAGLSNAQPFYPLCNTASSDTDGDGWGWEGNQSCFIQNNSNSSGTFNQSSTFPGYPVCQLSSSDRDGDGYGWENNTSCVVGNSSQTNDKVAQQSVDLISFPACSSAVSDTDNDGYGFENGHSCIVLSTASNNNSTSVTDFPVCNAASDPDGDGYGWQNGASCVVSGSSLKKSAPSATSPNTPSAKIDAPSINDVTDVVLVTGQSNVLASNTDYDNWLDAPDDRVFAYTNQGWRVADLFQTWDRFKHPGNLASSTSGREPNNSFAFHFGKSLVGMDSGRVVAFIVVPGPGQGISSWDRGSSLYNVVSEKVKRALADIPHKNSVDAVLWHQGENDWLYEGTADANPTGFTSKDSYEYRNYYQIKLDALIRHFRSESWGRSNTGFICGETRRAEGVNRRLNALNSDSDPLTACVPATDLPKRNDDPFGSHFSAVGLRALGQRYAEAYFNFNSR